LAVASASATATATDQGAKDGPTRPQAATGESGTTPDLLRKLVTVWRLNRTLEASLVVAVGAAVAVILASGGLGASDASQFGIPLDTAARATSTPLPPPTLATAPTPAPTLAPHITALPSISPGAGGSANLSPSAAPVKTAVPVHGPAN
jgi:hypothetical protein